MIPSKITIIIIVCVAGSGLGLDLTFPQNEFDPQTRGYEDAGYSRIGIIVSPIMAMNRNRMLKIYWIFSDLQLNDDKVKLYAGYPGANGSQTLYSFRPKRIRGIRRTKIRAHFVPTWEHTFVNRCLTYYVAWYRKNELRKMNCLATHPNWMSLRRATLGSKRLNEIFIPGTHDSAAYLKEEPSRFESVVDKYVITQDEDVLSQLVYGARYLDIRVGRMPGSGPIVFWGNHGYISVNALEDIINDVKFFLSNTEEIVIFDIHGFPIGFRMYPLKAHKELVLFLKEKFAGYYLPKTPKLWGMSLNDIWATGRRLIISYNEDDIHRRYGATWPPVLHLWPNVVTKDELYTKINEFENAKTLANYSRSWDSPPTSVMAQVTPGALDVVLNRLEGLRVMANLVNMNVTFNYYDKWRCTANIVSMDFIKASGIIDAALEWNDRRPSVC